MSMELHGGEMPALPIILALHVDKLMRKGSTASMAAGT